MRVLIDIPENDYKTLQMLKDSDIGLGLYHKAILDGIVIPDSATNGNVFEILFPETELKYVGNMIGATEYEGKCIDIVVDDKWWNASYKGEDND